MPSWNFKVFNLNADLKIWFHRPSCDQSASASHQNQRTHRFTCGGGFLSQGFRCSFTFLLQKWQQLASTLCFLGGFYKVVLSVSLYYKPAQSRTRSVYCCRKATEIRQLRACTTYHPAYFNFLIYPSLSCNLFCFHLRYVRQSQGLFTWSAGTPVWWGWFLLCSRSGGHKTKETYPTKPGSPTPCKQGLSRTLCAPRDFLLLHVNFPFYFHCNGCIKAMLVAKNKSISLLWELNSIFV